LKKIFVSIITLLIVFTTFLSSPALAADLDHGKQLFTANCASCHVGGKNLVNPAKTLALSDLEKYQMNSIEAITYQITKGKNAMPAFAGRLKPVDIEDVASYVLATAEKGW
jgi:cytochrome c6